MEKQSKRIDMAMEDDKASEELMSKLKIDESKPESQNPDLEIDHFQQNPHLDEGESCEEEEEDSDGEDDKVSEELRCKLKIDESTPESQNPDLKIDHFQQNPHLDEEESGKEEDSDDEEFEFSFPSGNFPRSPISADEAFQNGQIRPAFDRSLLDGAAGPAREPLMKFFTAAEVGGTAEEIRSAAGLGRKSNSTGSSRVWRFRELVRRSSSDGKDAFVFMNPPEKKVKGKKVAESVAATQKPPEKKAEKKVKGKMVAASVAAHERHYGKNRAEAERRRSYLPYRPGLVGFFTNVNGLSRNVHPF